MTETATLVPRLDIRLRTSTPGLLSLPWHEPLGEWDATEVPIRDVPVGPSRHLVRFVEGDPGRLYALKELPVRLARKEYGVLRALEAMQLPSVRAVGSVEQPFEDTAILVTEYLQGSWQYRRLFMRMPAGLTKHSERLLDAMAGLLVDLHRNGVFWGDCSLNNTLFKRDGQVLQAYLVDAESSEVHDRLSDGQRNLDLGIMVENVTAGLVDVANRLGRPTEEIDEFFAAASSVRERYDRLWAALHEEVLFGYDERYKAEAQVRRLEEMGFAVDELRLVPAGEGMEALRLKVAVAGRRFHAEQLERLTGLEVTEGQAAILLNDFRAWKQRLERKGGGPVPDAASRWLQEHVRPGSVQAVNAIGHGTDPIQAYCDLLEVRWLLSEEAQRDVGVEVALAALEQRTAPLESAARLAVVEATTQPMPALEWDDDEDDEGHEDEWSHLDR